jgi:hypothetical protein
MLMGANVQMYFYTISAILVNISQQYYVYIYQYNLFILILNVDGILIVMNMG